MYKIDLKTEREILARPATWDSTTACKGINVDHLDAWRVNFHCKNLAAIHLYYLLYRMVT